MAVTALKRVKEKNAISADVELITPEIAQKYLNTNTTNRHVRKGFVNQLARDMAGGRWRFSPHGIIFDKNGILIDGQHRLLAIIKSNCSLLMFVFRGAEPKTMEIIDIGRNRSLTDRAQICGRFNGVTVGHSSTLEKMVTGMTAHEGALSATEKMIALEKHWEAVNFACQALKYKLPGVVTSATRAVIARAFYSVNHKKLRHFCHVLGTGEIQSGDDAVILVLLRYLITKPAHGRTIRNEKYRKTERALDAFLRGENLKRLYPTSFELFPLPEEIEERV